MRFVVASTLSLVPLLAAAVAWYAVGSGDFIGYSWHRPLRWPGFPTPTTLQPIDARLVARCLLPPITVLLPALPVAVIGREMGRLHREDYWTGVSLLGLIVCAGALLFAVAWETDRPSPFFVLRPHEWPQRVGRGVAVLAPLAAAGCFSAAGISAARRRRRDRARRKAWYCPGCGYDLRGNPWRCPECGRRYVPMGPPSA